MSTITGTYRNGHIALDAPVEWPEGTRVEVLPTRPERLKIGVGEDEWDNTPEGIEAWLRWYHSLEPLEFTPNEEAELAAWRQKVKESETANVARRLEGLFE